ncbi:armadillo-type protein [Coprinopsis sp. MPI-PUGE-AT-0042]|nr:armadillo-type protein [Coprinopsis sp. MPI-PUGE-AT-0042]
MTDLARESPVDFMRVLLNEMKRVITRHENTVDGVNDESRSAAAGTINTAQGRRLQSVVSELLRCFIQPRWNNIGAVQLLVDLTSSESTSEGIYCKAVKACLSQDVNGTWDTSQIDGVGTVPLVASLVQSLVVRGWSYGVNLLLVLALHSTCIDTRGAAVRSLLSLSNDPDLWESIRDGITSRIRMLDLKQPTAHKAEQNNAVANWKVLLVVISITATARDFCSCILGHMNNGKFADRDLILPIDPPQVALSDYTEQIGGLSLHPNVYIQQAALECLARTVPEYDATSVAKQLVGLALKASTEQLRRFCLTRLVDMASNVTFILPTITAIQDVDSKKLDSVSDIVWRKEWVNLLKCVSRHGTYVDGFISLVGIAETDELWEVRVAAIKSLGELAVDHAEAIVTRTALGRSAKLGLLDPIDQARKAWVSTLHILSTIGHWKEGQDALMDMALYDDEQDVRYQAYIAIDTLLHTGADRASLMLTSLTNAFDHIIKGNHFHDYFVEDVGSGRSSNVDSPLNLSEDLASPFLRPLVKQSLVDSDITIWVDAILTSIATDSSSDYCQIVSKYVAENLGASSPRGAKKAMELVSLMRQRSDSYWHIEAFVAWLPPLLQHGSRHVRAAAVDIFSTVFSGECSYSDNIGAVISPLVSMALEDRDDGLRNEPAKVLRLISTSDYSYIGRELAAPVSIRRFLELLSAPRPLNTTISRLLGVLYEHDDARERIGLWIIDKVVVAQDIPANFEHGILSLLFELVSKQILKPTVSLDYLLLLLSSSLALKGTPTAESYRPLILASLSLHYQSHIPNRQSESAGELARSLEYAAFGRHGTEAEAKAWLAMDQYLQEQPQSSQKQDFEGAKHPFIQAFKQKVFKKHGAEGGLEGRPSMSSEYRKPFRGLSLAIDKHLKPSQSQAVELESSIKSQEDIA